MIVSKRKFEKLRNELHRRERLMQLKVDGVEKCLQEYEHRWKSADGKLVLKDLEQALQLVVKYQHSLWVLSASDPQVVEARALLKKWGMQPEKTFNENVPGVVDPNEIPKSRWDQELEEWGEEAMGTDTMELIAERGKDGDSLRFVPIEEEIPPCPHYGTLMQGECDCDPTRGT